VCGICVRHMCAAYVCQKSRPNISHVHGICAPRLLTPLCMCRCSFDGKNAMALNKGWSVDICTSKYGVCVEVCVLQVFLCVQVCALQVFPSVRLASLSVCASVSLASLSKCVPCKSFEVCALQVFPSVTSCAWCALSCLVRSLSVCRVLCMVWCVLVSTCVLERPGLNPDPCTLIRKPWRIVVVQNLDGARSILIVFCRFNPFCFSTYRGEPAEHDFCFQKSG